MSKLVEKLSKKVSNKKVSYVVRFKDEGQDLLGFEVTDNGEIVKGFPFHADRYVGGYIPIRGIQKIGEVCMIHCPPLIEYGFLKFIVESICEVDGVLSVGASPVSS